MTLAVHTPFWDAMFGLGFVIVGVCLGLLIAAIKGVSESHAALERASHSLDEAELVRGPLGVLVLVRGSIDGVPVVFSKRGVELEGEIVLGAVPQDRWQLQEHLRELIARRRSLPLVRGAIAGATCPYCKDELAPRASEATVRCPSCDAVHHTTCWQEHGGCSVHGCARVPREGSRVNGR